MSDSAPIITIDTKAYLRWLWYAQNLPTEIFMFGITDRDNPKHIVDIFIPKQEATASSVEVDSLSHANYLVDQSEKDLEPHQYASVFLHTHPKGMTVTPSKTDREEFDKFYSNVEHAIMGILNGKGESTMILRVNYPKLQFKGEMECKLEIPTPKPPDFWTCLKLGLLDGVEAMDPADWEKEASVNITVPPPPPPSPVTNTSRSSGAISTGDHWVNRRINHYFLRMNPDKDTFLGFCDYMVQEGYNAITYMNGTPGYSEFSADVEQFLHRYAEQLVWPMPQARTKDPNPDFVIVLRGPRNGPGGTWGPTTYRPFLCYYDQPRSLGAKDNLHEVLYSFVNDVTGEEHTHALWVREVKVPEKWVPAQDNNRYEDFNPRPTAPPYDTRVKVIPPLMEDNTTTATTEPKRARKKNKAGKR